MTLEEAEDPLIDSIERELKKMDGSKKVSSFVVDIQFWCSAFHRKHMSCVNMKELFMPRLQQRSLFNI